ncbi:MAG: hypothetical protein B6D38_11910 [Anaerolineae bacterium UTCFX1]|jgi:vacuolar-type H+-ATPase subunit E/Vma4|nr:MAG: hypothetical protein B6D38_11910 [Anaerolineae bacterium UTCFX1]
MSLPAILEQIREAGREQVREVEDRARAAAHALLAKARADASQIEAEAAERVTVPGVAKRARILHQARLNSLKIVGKTKEDWLNIALAETETRLTDIRADARYPGVLRALIREALNELVPEGKESFQLEADPRDQALVEDFLSEQGLRITSAFTLNCWGGIIIKSVDGKISINNTLEARLKRATPFLRGRLAAWFEREWPGRNGA